MKIQRIAALLGTALALTNPSFAQDAGKSASTKAAAVARAMDNAMTPGDYQQRLEPMVGNFDVRVLIWVDPSKPPIETSASTDKERSASYTVRKGATRAGSSKCDGCATSRPGLLRAVPIKIPCELRVRRSTRPSSTI